MGDPAPAREGRAGARPAGPDHAKGCNSFAKTPRSRMPAAVQADFLLFFSGALQCLSM